MKVVVKTAKGVENVEARDVPGPRRAPNKVKIKAVAAGICGTDIHIYYDEYPLIRPPAVIGDEISGKIVDYGKNVKEFGIGDQVISETHAYVYGKCGYCRTGYPNLCPDGGQLAQR